MSEKMTAKMSSFRLKPELLDALDRAAAKLEKEHGGFGPPWNRTDVLRYFIKRGLAELGVSAEEEAESPPRKAPTPNKRRAGPPPKKGSRGRL